MQTWFTRQSYYKSLYWKIHGNGIYFFTLRPPDIIHPSSLFFSPSFLLFTKVVLGPPGGPGGGGGGTSLAVFWTATNLVTDVSIWWRSPPSVRVDIFRLVRQRICDLPPIGPGGIGHLEWAVRSLWQCPLSLDTHGLELRGLIGSLVDTSPLKASRKEPQGGQGHGQGGQGQGERAHGGQPPKSSCVC